MKSFKIFLEKNINITYSKILKNDKTFFKNKKIIEILKILDRKELSGGFGAVLNYPDENPSNIVIAYDNKIPIGWISVTNNKYQNIYVSKKYRKIGIASKLKDIIYNRKST